MKSFRLLIILFVIQLLVFAGCNIGIVLGEPESNHEDIPPVSLCNDGDIQQDEICDSNTIDCSDLDSGKWASGVAVCNSECGSFDTSECEAHSPVAECNDGEIEQGETCDSNTINCSDLDSEKWASGIAVCNSECSGFDTSECEVHPPVAVCNNGEIEQDETCDGNTIDCSDLDSEKWTSGVAVCNSECSGFDTSECEAHPPVAQPIELGAEPNRYQNYTEISTLIKDWAQAGSQVLEVGTYGRTNGYDHYYLRLSAAVSDASLDLPKVMIDSCIHGDEWIATATLLMVIHRLVENYAVEDAITELVQTRDIYFVPVSNPASYDRQSRYENGEDPNRSFPGPSVPNNRPTASVAKLMQFFIDREFNATLNYHASGRMVLIPWGHTRERFEEGDHGARHRSLAQKMGNAANYRWGSIPDMVGYTAQGGSMDWFYVEGQNRGFNTCAMGIEAGSAKKPSANQIPSEANRNYDLIVAFVLEGPELLSRDARKIEDVQAPVYDTQSPYFVPGLE